jgi:hypothetical protein
VFANKQIIDELALKKKGGGESYKTGMKKESEMLQKNSQSEGTVKSKMSWSTRNN